MKLEVGDVIHYRDYDPWTIKWIEISNEYLDPGEESYEVYHMFDKYSGIDQGSITYNDIMENYVKYNNLILPKAKMRDVKINEILDL